MIRKEQSQKNDTNLRVNPYIYVGIILFCRPLADRPAIYTTK